MSTTVRYELFGIGKLPADLRASLEGEGMLHLYEGIPVKFRFTGQVPGLVVEGTNTRTYSGALAITRRRIVGTLSVVPKLAGKAFDIPWEAASTGPAHVVINEQGVSLDLDINQIDPEWEGRLSLHFALTFSREELSQLPRKEISILVPPEYVLKLIGVPA